MKNRTIHMAKFEALGARVGKVKAQQIKSKQ